MTDNDKFVRACNLQEKLKMRTGLYKNIDHLRDYRIFLEGKGIVAEVDGWPTEAVYDEKNIEDYIETMIIK